VTGNRQHGALVTSARPGPTLKQVSRDPGLSPAIRRLAESLPIWWALQDDILESKGLRTLTELMSEARGRVQFAPPFDDWNCLEDLAYDQEPCHCGSLPFIHEDGFTRGLCEPCDARRCDVAEGPCPRTTASRCAMCGHTPSDHRAGYLGGSAYDGDQSVDLCHVDSPCGPQGMTCYHRWTVYGDRPGGKSADDLKAPFREAASAFCLTDGQPLVCCQMAGLTPEHCQSGVAP
jgi:hypothetical protein